MVELIKGFFVTFGLSLNVNQNTQLIKFLALPS